MALMPRESQISIRGCVNCVKVKGISLSYFFNTSICERARSKTLPRLIIMSESGLAQLQRKQGIRGAPVSREISLYLEHNL